MRKKKYESLREQYPEYVSLDQLYRICGIAKRSALYLIQHDVIPSIDTGKKTWRYKIALEDVVDYLRKREKRGNMIPPGSASSRYKRSNNPRKSFAALVSPGLENDIAEYFAFIYADYPDVLSAADVAEMTGLAKKTILIMLRNGEIKSVASHPKYLIPKAYLLEFVATRRFIESRSNTEHFKKILGGYGIWKTAKS